MKNKKMWTPVLVVLLILVPLAVAGLFTGCKGQQVSQISKELADDLTGSMTFQNGSTKSGTPPAEHAGSSGYPQSSLSKAPDILAGGESFSVKMQVNSSGTSIAGALSTDAVATCAVVYMWNTAGVYNNYIQISVSQSADGSLTLNGSLGDVTSWMGSVDELTFRIYVGACTGTSTPQVGNYNEWIVTVVNANCLDISVDTQCAGVYACKNYDLSKCWGWYKGNRYYCDYCPLSDTEAAYLGACPDAVEQISALCSGGGGGEGDCYSMGTYGTCGEAKACCEYTSGTMNCWYETSTKNYPCNGEDCSAAANDLFNDCYGAMAR